MQIEIEQASKCGLTAEKALSRMHHKDQLPSNSKKYSEMQASNWQVLTSVIDASLQCTPRKRSCAAMLVQKLNEAIRHSVCAL